MNNEIIKRYKEKGLIVPATYDKVFKAIMQDEDCRDYLVEIIHGCTNLPKDYIKENIVFKNSELPVEYLQEKQKITDLVIEVEANIINLEMNNFYYKGLIERNDIYLNELRKLHIGQRYVHIPKVIQINFDNFDRFDGKTIRKFMILDVENYEKETENYEKYHINLKTIKEKYYNKEKLTKLEKRLLLLVLDKKDELEKVSSGDDIMKKVEEKLTVLSQDAAMILCYDEEEYKEIVREAVTRTEVEEAKDTALKEGREEGIKQGIKQEKTKVAQNMLNKGLDKDLIKEITGLSLEEINDLD